MSKKLDLILVPTDFSGLSCPILTIRPKGEPLAENLSHKGGYKKCRASLVDEQSGRRRLHPGLVWIYRETGSLELQQIINSGNIGAGVYLLSLALFCFAAFTKSAQFPFQSWLLGAMVAPTPVSALLHSSTMVNVGVYLVLRLSPVMRETFLSQSIALIGAFTFLAEAALAVGQSNGKKVLAYSTISNLGLIFACTGLNTPESIVAGLLLLVFHAIIKALLFLCVVRSSSTLPVATSKTCGVCMPICP